LATLPFLFKPATTRRKEEDKIRRRRKNNKPILEWKKAYNMKDSGSLFFFFSRSTFHAHRETIQRWTNTYLSLFYLTHHHRIAPARQTFFLLLEEEGITQNFCFCFFLVFSLRGAKRFSI
jgi:hypothetical protein